VPAAGDRGLGPAEVLFYLALTFGLEEDPRGAVERAIGLVEATGERHGIEHPFQGAVSFSNGEQLWAVRHSTEHHSRTLFVSQGVSAVRALHPDNPRLQGLSEETARSLRVLGGRLRRVARGAGVDGARGPTRLPRAASIHAPAPIGPSFAFRRASDPLRRQCASQWWRHGEPTTNAVVLGSSHTAS